MRRSALIAFGILALVITVPATSLRATRAHEESAAAGSTTAATLANQVELAVTVYNSNIAAQDRNYTRFTAFLTFNGEYVR